MWNPEDYAQNSAAQWKWAQELRKNIDWSNYRSILDVGCGDGKITADLAVTLPSSKVLGIDNSPAMIAYAAQKYPKSQYSNLSYLLAYWVYLHLGYLDNLDWFNSAQQALILLLPHILLLSLLNKLETVIPWLNERGFELCLMRCKI